MKNRRNIVEQQNPPQNPNDIWLKDGKFYRSTSEGWTIIDSELEYTNKETMIADNPKGGTIGIDKESGEPSIYNDVTKQWSPLGGGVTETTWQELKDKRDAGKLTPGALYRITDYQCTTTQENTRSAGHQFDIVLLALSEDKLAEEGWAMMHNGVDMFDDYDIYTITFNDGVSKEYYLKIIKIPDRENPDIPFLNTRIIDVKTFRGNEIPNTQIEPYGFIIDDNNKTATNAYVSSTQFEELLTVEYPHNYFQNSNLSAWKVWYCLDNDTTRFAWADDSVDEDVEENIKINGGTTPYFRYIAGDMIYENTKLYAWKSLDDIIRYSKIEEIESGILVYQFLVQGLDSAGTITSYTSYHKGTGPNGRGVIYRLIDEFNNDIPYDFKNIQFKRKLNAAGDYDPESGENTWVYTFSLNDDGIVVDATFPDERGNIWASHNIVNADFELPDNVFFGNAKSCFISLGSTTNTITNGISVILHNTVKLYDDGVQAIIYLNNKKVLTES